MPKWWNGRHDGLKIHFGQLSAGSSPAFGTKQNSQVKGCFLFVWYGGTWVVLSHTQTLFAPHTCWVRHTLVKIEKFVFQFSRHSLSRLRHQVNKKAIYMIAFLFTMKLNLSVQWYCFAMIFAKANDIFA